MNRLRLPQTVLQRTLVSEFLIGKLIKLFARSVKRANVNGSFTIHMSREAASIKITSYEKLLIIRAHLTKTKPQVTADDNCCRRTSQQGHRHIKIKAAVVVVIITDKSGTPKGIASFAPLKTALETLGTDTPWNCSLKGVSRCQGGPCRHLSSPTARGGDVRGTSTNPSRWSERRASGRPILIGSLLCLSIVAEMLTRLEARQ